MVKPRVFLSHSKKDQQFIEKLSSDLRAARIDVWYDEWEIPSGISLRRHIFDEGIPNCDLFFVYLTPNSAESYWVRSELDAAFIEDARKRGGFITLFVDNDETRELLSLDLKPLRSPILNNDNYMRPFGELISRAWEACYRRIISEVDKNHKIQILELKNELAERDIKIAQMLSSSRDQTVQSIISRLESKSYNIDGKDVSAAEIFHYYSNLFAAGVVESGLRMRLLNDFFKKESSYDFYGATDNKYRIEDFIGPFILNGLLKVIPPTNEVSELIYITDLGSAVACELAKS